MTRQMKKLPKPILLVLAIFSVTGIAHAQETLKFLPSEHLSGVFFSNFENAKFFVCKSKDDLCIDWVKGEAYSLFCDKATCAALDEKIPEINVTVYLHVDLIGQRSIGQTAPKFLGDPGRVIRVEKIETVTPIKPK